MLIDKESGYIYLESFLWYTDAKLPEEQQSALEQVLAKYLSEEEKVNIMRTIAQKYIEEGEFRGIQIGKAERNIEVATKMLAKGSDPAFISTVTGLDEDLILSLSNSKATHKSKL